MIQTHNSDDHYVIIRFTARTEGWAARVASVVVKKKDNSAENLFRAGCNSSSSASLREFTALF